jgi:hypothetical protein
MRQLMSRPQSGGAVSSKIWALAALEIWFRVFILQDLAPQECEPAGGGLG